MTHKEIHATLAIACSERDQRLRCLALSMRDIAGAEPLRERPMQSFYDTADRIRNKAGTP